MNLNNTELALLMWWRGEKPRFSSGICGNLTAGYGELDDLGYWEFGLPNELVSLMDRAMDINLLSEGKDIKQLIKELS